MLEQILPEQVFSVFFVFVRMGAAFAMLPGIAEAFVAMRFRLLLAGATSLILAPVVGPELPALPESPLTLGLMVSGEAAVGLFMGLTARLALSAIQTAGMIIGLQTSLANAFAFDPTTSHQGTVMNAWLSSLALVLIFVTDLHHLMLKALVDSYVLFPPGGMPPVSDLAEAMTRLVSASFKLGIQISAPFLAFGFVFFLALGLIARLMPQVQVFFVAQPLQIVIGFVVLAGSIAFGMSVFLDSFASMVTMLAPGR